MTKKIATLHPRNPHQGRYDLTALVKTYPALQTHITQNPSGEETVDFSDDKAVVCLNAALLAHFYQVPNWQIPAGYLCPPIPGRADYIHYIADLLAEMNNGEVPTGKRVKALDIGTGANCIYPILGHRSYGWGFVGTDVDKVAAKTANVIVQANPGLNKAIKIVLKKTPGSMFKGVIKHGDRYSVTVCNPPFHASMEAAAAGTERKIINLHKGKAAPTNTTKLNFGGQHSELWCEGGELRFVKDMAKESKDFTEQVCWFTSLISKGEHIEELEEYLNTLDVKQIRVIPMSQGQKVSRILAWSFMDADEQQQWAADQW
ncbi:MAG: 23S rRNA (adenine1618-N6)-methyltransferase [Moritella dasanensis]|jgi:23S rRNA (adenine1618-N6)-methyltransferase|uniref:23S rRNA (adenine(1618)-N(6))-methyltransferase RlmF n=1 Tax=Moritella TaxID=58050 RepID=UPI000313AEEE|nr:MULTISPECIES: 23S rRNA (adenine(1618)-N(6))-methyltransferase RlmF [Moritella]PKH09653.1 23S rRNA (adenine(1618)-N(6))-methyltransferase RlmF [Moritella sp. Urea-trap-13]